MSTSSAPLSPLAESWLELADGRLFWLSGRCAVGRHTDNDLVLDASSVSRHHALIAAEPAGYAASDLHSSNGTYLNRVPVTRPIALRDGDELRFGDAVLRYRCTHRAEPESPLTISSRPHRLEEVRERACWLLLADIAGYATLRTALGSKVARQHFKTWIAGMRPLLEKNGGHINSYMGDAIFAWWPADATGAGAALRAALREIDAWRAQSLVSFRIVVHHGAVRFTRTERGEELSGQEVNFVFRSEKIAKTFGASTMLSQAAVHTLGLDAQCPTLGAAAVDGMPGRFVFFGAPRTDATP